VIFALFLKGSSLSAKFKGFSAEDTIFMNGFLLLPLFGVFIATGILALALYAVGVSEWGETPAPPGVYSFFLKRRSLLRR
jgi:hypothetical protein